MPKKIPDSAQELGIITMAFTASLRRENIQPILEKYGLHDLQPDQWYPMQVTVQLYHELADMFDKVSWGIEIGKVVTQQTQGAPYEEYVQHLSEVYHSVHRGEGIGDVIGKMAEPGHAIITTTTPYPDDLEYGVFYGIAKALLPPEARLLVYYDENVQRRDFGGERTVYHVQWE